jgi:hypothetical protein
LSSAEGKQQIREAFFEVYPSAVGSRLDDLSSIQDHCGVCHFRFTGGGTRNPYGRAVEAALGNFPNTDQGRRDAVMSVENLDSDGDGYLQLIEITDLVDYANTPTFPGLTPANVDSTSGVNVNDLLAYLVPETGGDTEAPVVTVLTPDGGEAWEGGSQQSVTWSATDNVGVTSVDVFYRDGEGEPWIMIAREIGNGGAFAWFVHNTPSAEARVRVAARDAAGNEGSDASDDLFAILLQPGGIVPTTLRDFHQPGTQPFEGGDFQESYFCTSCHGYYDEAVEPGHNFNGTMMAQAARDPLFYAAVTVAEQDAPSSGDLCLRCHSPFGWMRGRSQPTGGEELTYEDRDGVACDFCHRQVDPIYVEGESPPEDLPVLNALHEVPTTYGNGMYVIDPATRRRGPFGDSAAPHAWLESPFHRSSDVCGVCHDVSNPVFERVAGADYAPGPLDEPASVIDPTVLLPLERTYSEWSNSDFPSGVFAPDFSGSRPDSTVSTCQDCHMRDVVGKGCSEPEAPVRSDLPLHDMMGGSSWMPTILDQVFEFEVDPDALADGASRAVSMLEKAALLDLFVEAEGDSFRALVTVTNRSGHKLPTGYPEGRRMWIYVAASDEADAVVYESGFYDAAAGELVHDDDLVVYEAKMGISPSLGLALGLLDGPSFHFALNDSVYKDNRIPPLGFDNGSFQGFGGGPVDPDRPEAVPRYADGQYWDVSEYRLPTGTTKVVATLYYQSTSSDYVEFLRDENATDSRGQEMYDLWAANGRAAPVAMVADTVLAPTSTAPEREAPLASVVRLGPNPFASRLEFRLHLSEPSPVRIDVYDLAGRRVRTVHDGPMGAGPALLAWDGRDAAGRDVGSGLYWARVTAAGSSRMMRIVRIR